MTYQAHIETLAQEHGIAVEYTSYRRGTAYRKKRLIKIPAVKSDVTYALALHELGHILGPNPLHRLEQEAAAWVWAKENAAEWTRRMTQFRRKALQSYVRRAERKGMRLPKRSHTFWRLA